MANAFTAKKIYSERTLGEHLRQLRRRKHLSLDQAEEETKVRRRFLEALEKGDYAALPADVYSMGFLAKYTEFLGANKEELLAEYRRERGGLATSRILSPQTAVSGKRIILTPKLLTIGAIILIFLGLFGYIFYSVRNFTSPPNLEISSPSTETVIRQETVEIIGKTDEGASLKINDQTVFIDNKGNFHETIKLQSGMNNIEVVATNRIRKETVKVVKILAEF